MTSTSPIGAGLVDLTVAMPAYNEIGNLEEVVRDLFAELPPAPFAFEIVLVDDGSTDGTAGLADRLAAEIPHVRAVHHAKNRGLGAAWRTCVLASRGRWVFLQPADGQLAAPTARRFYEARGDADVVVGIRGTWRRSLYRRVLTNGFHLASKVTLGVSLSGDYGVCFLFRGDLVRSFSAVSGDRGVAVMVEWLFLAHRGKAKVSEVAADVLPRSSGSSKGGRIIDSAATLLHLVQAGMAYRLFRRPTHRNDATSHTR